MGPLVAVPILAGLNGFVGIWAVFGVARSTGTVNLTEHFPYISTCGDKPPASCLFSQVCNTACILAVIFETVHFQCLKNKCSRLLNLASFVLGIVSSGGLSITGNFQVSSIRSVHYIGAFLGFVGGLTYLCIQLLLIRSRILKYFGIVVSAFCAALLFSLVFLHFNQYYHAAAICEWTLASLFFVLYPLFVSEFANIECELTITVCGSDSAGQPQSEPGDPE